MSLAARLLSEGGRTVARARLAAEIWPNTDVAKARQSLRNALFHVRAAFGDEAVLADAAGIALDPERFHFDPIDPEDVRFAEQLDDPWAAAIRANASMRSAIQPSLTDKPPVDAFLTTLDYMIDFDPASAVALASSAHSLTHRVPVHALVPRLESILIRAPQSERETLLVRLLLATKYQSLARFSDAIDCLGTVAKVAEERRFNEIMEAAAYNLFSSWLLANKPLQAKRYADWLSERGATALSLMSQALWSFQFGPAEQAASKMREAAFAARLEGNVPCEQRALASLIAVDAASASDAVVARLDELGTLPSLGIGRFAAGFSQAVLRQVSGRVDDSKAEFERTIGALQDSGESRLVLGSLHYACLMLNYTGQFELAAEALGACEVWQDKNTGPLLPSETRNLKTIRANLVSELGREQFELSRRKGRQLSKQQRFHIR